MPKKVTNDAPADESAKRAARKAALDRLIQNHRAEYEEHMREEHASRGLTWRRRLTPEERAERDAALEREREARRRQREREREEKALAALLEKHPGLAERLQVETPEG